MLTLLLLFGIFVSEAHCGYFFVTAPNVLRFDQEQTVVVSVFNLTNASVKVWLEHGDFIFSERNVVVQDEETPSFTFVKVTENDTKDVKKVRKVRLCSEWNGVEKKRDIILSYHSGYLITQTDKPIYTPNERVKIRTLALDESLKAVKGWQVSMDVISPSNQTLSRKLIKDSPSGFFQNSFTLPPYPETGIWTARALFKGQLETESHALFEVAEYVLPTFGVTVDVNNEYILPNASDMIVTVKAKYVYGKPVKGNARLTLNLKGKDEDSDYILSVPTKQLKISSDVKGSVTEFRLDIKDIFNSPLLKGKPFPDGKRLEVIATVYESATGNEEAGSHDGIIFTKTPFVFKFTKSKLNFRPGFEYYLKVEVLYVNGKPAKSKDFYVEMSENGVSKGKKKYETNSDGKIIKSWSTSMGTKRISFNASTIDDKFKSDLFEVAAYVGRNQIRVESVITQNNEVMEMRATTNMNGISYTGMLFMIISRGKIMTATYKKPANSNSVVISNQLQESVSPDARILVFYVDKSTNDLVADSVKFEVEKKCRGEGLHLTRKKKGMNVKPGDKDELLINGSSNMYVGLNVIDKALYLLNDNNVLKKNKMFEILKSHDLGCGEGSGKSGADVIKKVGLTILTNANVDEADIERKTDNCMTSKRKRRDADSCYYGVEEMCCGKGYDLAERLYYEEEDPARMNPRTKCYPIALVLAKEKRLSIKCVMAFFKSCVDELEHLKTEDTSISSKSFETEHSYTQDIQKFYAFTIRTRSDFQESWLFNVLSLGEEGVLRKELLVPSSITEWEIQAIGITKDKGMCIADPVELNAFKEFFIQLHLPYNAVRLEHFNVKATIFNYAEKEKTCSFYLEGVDNLCYNRNPGEPSPRLQIQLPANSAKTVSFPMVPLKSGYFTVKMSAIVTDSIMEIDVIEKKLFVVNEGIDEKLAIIVCLDPRNQRKDCVNDKRVIEEVQMSNDMKEYVIDLTLPQTSISQTGSATAYIQSSIMTNIVNTIIEGVDSLFGKPSGCGEQMMIKLAPTVYALTYLKQTKQMTEDLETKGNNLVKDGIVKQISQYRHADGAYSAWSARPASTWLTAFVAKVFCQAKEVVDDALGDVNDNEVTINWLNNDVNDDGSFNDDEPVMDRAMIGQINERDPTLTAFVLITLQECKIRSERLNTTVQKAIKYLEDLHVSYLKDNPYLLAISTYALSLSDSEEKYNFKKLLLDIKKDDSYGSYWGITGGKPANANSVETTAYALLAMLQFNDIYESSPIVSWLTSQRDGRGSFRSTQDTVVGLQALSQYSIATYSPDVNLKVTLYADDWPLQEILVTKENAIVQKVVPKLPVERGENKFYIRVQGTGSAIVTIDMHYNRPATEEETCPFNISDIDVKDVTDIDPEIAEARNCDICGYCDGSDDDDHGDNDSNNFNASRAETDPKIESNFGRKKRDIKKTKKCIRFSVSSKNITKRYGMSIVKFGLETDVEVIKDDLAKLIAGNNSNIARFEMPSDGKGFLVFYLNEITSSETNFTFRFKDNSDGEKRSRQPASVFVYDYYNPDDHCTKIYSTDPNWIGVPYKCGKNNKECTCLHSMCVQPVESEIKKLYEDKKRPAKKLFNYACNMDKANYAVRVKIEELAFDNVKQQNVARGVVESILNEGIKEQQIGAEMTFFWKLPCTEPKLEEGKTYIIIGRDGYKIYKDGEEKFHYPLMGTTLVIEHVSGQKCRKKEHRAMCIVLKNFQTLLEKKGCQH